MVRKFFLSTMETTELKADVPYLTNTRSHRKYETKIINSINNFGFESAHYRKTVSI